MPLFPLYLERGVQKQPLSSSPVKFRTYTGKPLAILGQRMVCDKYEKQKCNLPLIVLAGTGPSLFDLN